MNDRERVIYRQVVRLVDDGATADELKWWAAAQIRNLDELDAIAVAVRMAKLPA